MFSTLSRNPKTIAWFLVTLFYLNLVCVPLSARVNTQPLPFKTPASSSAIWSRPVTHQMPATKAFDKVPENSSYTHLSYSNKSPVKATGTFTTGPTQPETQSFQSVNANNMVDLFTGDFSYNIPLLDVGGYPVNLHYQSGITIDQEASWVGLGWNINPGVISRNMRGLPDDFQGGQDYVKKTVSMKPNRTIGATIGAGVEIYGLPVNFGFGAGHSLGVFHNTYKGWGIERSLHASINAAIGSKGHLSGGISITHNSQNGTDISPSMGFQLGTKESKTRGGITIGTNYNSRTGIQNLQITGEIKQQHNALQQQRVGGGYRASTNISFAQPSYTPTISIPWSSWQVSFRAKGGGYIQGYFPNRHVQGYLSEQTIKNKTEIKPAYGYLYYEKANNNLDALLDFNREKDIAWSENAPHIAVPVYTYDTWSISGEGTGGMFRAYRGDIGFVFDHRMSTKSKSDNLGVDMGFGSVFHTGVDYNKVNAVTNSNAWTGDNQLDDVIPFRQADTTFEPVYFKNPGEKTAVNKQFHQAIGGEYLMRSQLASADQNNSKVSATTGMTLFKNSRPAGTINFDLNTVRKERDKRTQVISYLTAKDAAIVGLDTVIKSYLPNSFPATSCNNNYEIIKRTEGVRQPHHLSEVTVLNDDGRRYVYGIPVYNKLQVDITMSTEKGDNATGLVHYSETDKSENNNKGKEGYFNKEVIQPYSHSFLLSGILSSDYVDLTGDGITEDDMGDAVKFNYSRVFSTNQPYKWRAPYQAGQAAYNEGLKSDSRDERGSFTYGEREVWYLNSVESKTMIATFVLDMDSSRKDSYGVTGEDGGLSTSQKLYRLKEINLYTKADYMKNGGAGAKPIKTVHFEYSYELCKNNPASINGNGKLTLKKVWFSYNKNNKGKRNPYIFTYNAANPDFSQNSVDRWGNYKNPKDNPGSTGQELTNADYPYSLQAGVKNWDAAKAAANAAPWTLSEIGLPSGGKIKVTYESDDYAYVQNKRAMQFFSVAGFGNSETGSIQAKFYPDRTPNNDYHHVFINVTEPVFTKSDITRKYLEGVTQLFFKLAVNMPADKWGKGFELVPCYAEIENYGVRANSNNKIIWIKVKSIRGSESPFATAALQFLRLNLPSKAYPWSEPGDKIDVRAAVGILSSVAGGVFNLFKVIGFGIRARLDNRCNSVVLEKSFVRLDNPIYKKFGGGLRVKQVELYDNWNAMSGQRESVYGQTYSYTDTVSIDGVRTCISSGVASYEPAIGNDENPFRVPVKVYTEKVGALAPANFLYSEEPFAETFFPAPGVGYSKVRVQTIHKTKKSANGFDETEFYTTKDFPTLVEYTPIDNDSKKTFKTPISNPFYFDSRNYVTISQGFKVELNDMNGKLKSQATYSQNDLKKPISYTYYYYRVKNDNALQPKLSNIVSVVQSANGIIDTTAEIGKEVEVMIDVREQTSTTKSGSIEGNLDLVNLPPGSIPPVWPFITIIPMFNGETNRYRSIAVLKVVNRYGILDSVIHIEKGSKVTTRDLLYDGETGDVLLTQTNNEFDDPVYNFNYPAHWAYSGMGPAYRNIGTVLKNINFRKGIMLSSNGSRVPVERYFESGDEILVYGQDIRWPLTNDHCNPLYYQFASFERPKKIWAVDASKGKEGQKGIYFIDANGIPYSANTKELRIIRSGKRNMPGASIGAVTSLKTPVRKINDTTRLVFDTATAVIAAAAARFKDFWKVDSTGYAKDTTIIGARKVPLVQYVPVYSVDNYAIHDYRGGDNDDKTALGELPLHKYFEAYSFDDGEGSWHEQVRSFLKFNMDAIPQGALIQSATLYLYGCQNRPQRNSRNSNACYLERLKAAWPREIVQNPPFGDKGEVLSDYFWDPENETIDPNNRILLPETNRDEDVQRNEAVDITGMAQAMLDQYYEPGSVVSPAIRISLPDWGGDQHEYSRLSYNTLKSLDEECASGSHEGGNCEPVIEISYYPPCANGSRPVYSSTPEPGYYCYDNPVDTFVCKANINDTAVNFYRLGMLGNWRLDRAFTYYDRRAQSDPTTVTNIRTDGVINSFAPYWNFAAAYLTPSADTMRWVWNSEITKFNNKGYEIENHDPLNRFNSGQYGYNGTLPVAVAQNSKNREMAFDGFEDYGYRTDNCINCTGNRFIDLAGTGTLVDTISHSGLYSLRLNGNQTVSKTFSIGSLQQDTISPKLSMKEDSIPIITTKVNSNGTGLGNYYYTIGGCHPYSDNYGPQYLGVNSNVNYKSNTNPVYGICGSGNWQNNFYFSFQGYIQPLHTGKYTFWVTADDHIKIYISGNRITNGLAMEMDHNWTEAIPTHPINLQAGEVYDILILWDQFGGNYQAKLEWESEGLQPQSREIVPVTQLYPAGSNPATIKQNTVVSDTTWCVQFKNPTAEQITHSKFSPLQGKKVVVSAWVKQEQPCITGNYDNAQLELTFNNSGVNYFVLKPTGNIIEGWQRIEDTLTIPATATSVSLAMHATSGTPVYFDDIRIHPFNANMKSFVYNPVNLRLMAELDENNYATFYEYDDDGTLIRVKKETGRGVKTIKESRSALLKQ